MNTNESKENFLVLFQNKNVPKDRIIRQFGDLKQKTDKKPMYNELTYNVTTFSSLKKFSNGLKNDYMHFMPPHDYDTRRRLGNMYESDPYTKKIINFLTQYVFGTKPKPRIIPLEIDTPEDRKKSDEKIDKILTKRKHEKFKGFIARVDYLADIFNHVASCYQESYAYGASVSWKSKSTDVIMTPHSNIEIPIGTPILIKKLNAFELGRIYQDPISFEPQIYEYMNTNTALRDIVAKDGQTTFAELIYRTPTQNSAKDIDASIGLPFDRLIVVNRSNAGVTPNTYQYGMSPLVPLLPNSENIRRIDQKILPELNETQYAPIAIYKVPKDSSYNLETLASALSEAGNNIVINDDIEFIQVKMDSNIMDILKEKEMLIESQLTGIGVPSSIFNSEKIASSSAAEIIANIFQNVSLDDERTKISEMMWKFWYKDLLRAYFPDDKLLDLELKIELEFQNRTFTPYTEKAAQVIQEYLNGMISLVEARMALEHPAFSEYPLKIPASAAEKSNFGEAAGKQGGNVPPNAKEKANFGSKTDPKKGAQPTAPKNSLKENRPANKKPTNK